MNYDLPIIILCLAVVATVGALYCEYTKETESNADDKIGAAVGHFAGFAKFLLLVVRGKK